MTTPLPTDAERAWISQSPEETRRIAAELLASFPPGSVLALHGNLGAGKTCFVQGLAAALRVREPAHSPTFTLINEYHGRCVLNHIDLYRLDREEEILDLGWNDYMETDGYTVIEWAERAAGLLPPHTIHLEFETGDTPEERRIRLRKAGTP